MNYFDDSFDTLLPHFQAPKEFFRTTSKIGGKGHFECPCGKPKLVESSKALFKALMTSCARKTTTYQDYYDSWGKMARIRTPEGH